MSTPANQKKLWKNIDWTSKDEKRAFFNKYFKEGELVVEEKNKEIKAFKHRIITHINDIINEKDKPINLEELRRYVEGLE